MSEARRPFRFGLIGAGVAAEIHVAAMRTIAGVEVHAIADAAPERARALASRHGIPEDEYRFVIATSRSHDR